MALGGIPRTHANLEAEKGETALTDLDNDGVHELHTIGGNRHSSGGTPLNLPPQSFIFSDTAKMKFNTDELAELGIESTKKQTPAWVSKKHPLNKFIQGMDDEHSDNITNETAELMLHKNKLQLSKIAFMQEAKKDFLDEEGNVHVPLAAYPFLISKGVNPEEFVAKLEEINNQKKEAQNPQAQGMQPQGPPQGMPPQGMQQGPPMHQMPAGQMMPGASHGAPPQGPPMMNDGGEMQQLLQEIAKALQQGAKPEEIMQQLVQMGIPEEQAMQVLQKVIQSIQGQPQGQPQGQQGPPMMRSGGSLPCLSCGGSTMKHGGNPFSKHPLEQFVYGGQQLPEFQNGDETFENTLQGDEWASVREIWYKTYVDAAKKFNETPAGRSRPLTISDNKEEAFAAFYKFNEMNERAEVGNYNYDEGCDIDADGNRAANCKHNNRSGDKSYDRMKEHGLIDGMDNEEYISNTRQFQAMYEALGSLKHGPDVTEEQKALLEGLKIETSPEAAHNMKQYGFNVSSIDGKNGVLTSSSHVGIGDSVDNTEEIITEEKKKLCPDEAARSAECAARNTGGGTTAGTTAPPSMIQPESGRTGDLIPGEDFSYYGPVADESEVITNDNNQGPVVNSGEFEQFFRDGAELPWYQGDEGSSVVPEPLAQGAVTDNNPDGITPPVGGGAPSGSSEDGDEPLGIQNMSDAAVRERQSRAGTFQPGASTTAGAWTWNSETCQCVQSITPGGTPAKMIPWIQDQNNLAGAMRAKSQEEDFWPMQQKLNYNDVDYIGNDPLTRIHAANSLASGLGENATHAQRMDLFGKAAGSNREAVQNVQEADVKSYLEYNKANVTNRANVDASNSGFASKYVDDTNLVQANRIAKDQLHDANINKQNNALLTNMANTYNQNSLYPNYNVRPDYAGAIEFENAQALRDEQSQESSYPRMNEYAAWKAKYPDAKDEWIERMMGKAKENPDNDQSGRQGPGGYPGTDPAKYGREMRDLQANRKALRRWILGI